MKKAIGKAIYDQEFRRVVQRTKNPYGEGRAAQRIVEVLASIKIDKKLIQKR